MSDANVNTSTDSPAPMMAKVAAAKHAEPRPKRRLWIPAVILLGVGAVVGVGVFMMQRAESKTNKESLSQKPKPVSVATVKASKYQPTRLYIGTLEPWVQANVGPQLISAYVDTVLVRPGDIVKRGQVLATLDCRSANAASQAVAMQARAIDARQRAIAHESERIQGMLDGGFVSPNEAEQKMAQSQSAAAELQATQSKLVATALEVNDCILRAPFDGEVAARTADPGVFVRPGTLVLSVIDRSTVRMTADVPESDVGVVEPGRPVKIKLVATGKEVPGTISRRSPSADPGTRTVHFEVDLPDAKKDIPVNTTAEVHINAGEPTPASEIPLSSAVVRGTKATVYIVEAGVAHARSFIVAGEVGGSLFVDTSLPNGAKVVTEGRALLTEGDLVEATDDKPAPAAPAASAASTEKKEGGR